MMLGDARWELLDPPEEARIRANEKHIRLSDNFVRVIICHPSEAKDLSIAAVEYRGFFASLR
jgi:hypothetical protein